MSYKEAVLNCIHSKGIAYKKASLIKLQELAEIADKLERDNDMTREEAIQVLQTALTSPFIYGEYAEAIDMAIEALTKLQGEWIKHKGEWIDFDFYPTKYECSQCHYYVDEGYDSIFCPNCGARMKGGAE